MVFRQFIQTTLPTLIVLGFIGYVFYKVREKIRAKKSVKKLENNKWLKKLENNKWLKKFKENHNHG